MTNQWLSHVRSFFILVSFLFLFSCGGGGDAAPAGASGSNTASIAVSDCVAVAGDSTQNMDGSTSFVRSHTQGSPTYRITKTREDSNATDITTDYMVHEPVGTPKAIFVLIAGGPLDAGIEGVMDGGAATQSRGNFLVRSAHRYQAQGYRVITIDRPSDFATYGTTFSYEMDAYRNSMRHAVDITTIVKRENPEGYNVILSGTSRGGISVAANNTLAAAIAMSSPVTRSSAGGSPIGSAALPVNTIKRPSHLLLHTNDGCTGTTPENTRALFDSLDLLGNDVAGNEVSGGFQDTIRNDVCGAFDFHGFNGIEMCAVGKETAWADTFITVLGVNNPPVADSLAVNEDDAIILTANDADGDSLTYAVPYTTTSLGGSVSTTAAGNVTYNPPASVTSGAMDTFAFTVTDGNGGVGTAVVSITLN